MSQSLCLDACRNSRSLEIPPRQSPSWARPCSATSPWTTLAASTAPSSRCYYHYILLLSLKLLLLLLLLLLSTIIKRLLESFVLKFLLVFTSERCSACPPPPSPSPPALPSVPCSARPAPAATRRLSERSLIRTRLALRLLAASTS